jgi:GMP synthase (glutamine-hydrolysing)
MVSIEEVKLTKSNVSQFIKDRTKEIAAQVGSGYAINALSGGVDSSAVTMLGHRALGKKLKTYFVNNGIMRDGEPERIAKLFHKLGVHVEILDAQEKFFSALKGITDPEEKREAVTQTFYKDIFGKLVKKSQAKHLLQGTILTDVDETVAGIKRQHNVFEQLGINPLQAFGYKIIEPLVSIRKDGVRKVAEALGLPKATYQRIPFPGPALAARVIGGVTKEKIALVRKATTIVEEELKSTGAFQYMAILHQDRVTGMRNGKRDFGFQIEVRCWDSVDARTATPTDVPFRKLRTVADRMVNEVPGVVSVTYNIASKPPSTMEVV